MLSAQQSVPSHPNRRSDDPTEQLSTTQRHHLDRLFEYEIPPSIGFFQASLKGNRLAFPFVEVQRRSRRKTGTQIGEMPTYRKSLSIAREDT